MFLLHLFPDNFDINTLCPRKKTLIFQAESIIAQLRSEIQELTNQNSQLNMDCLALSDQTRVEREAHQGYMNQLKMQLATFQKDLEQKNQLLQQEEVSYCGITKYRFFHKVKS